VYRLCDKLFIGSVLTGYKNSKIIFRGKLFDFFEYPRDLGASAHYLGRMNQRIPVHVELTLHLVIVLAFDEGQNEKSPAEGMTSAFKITSELYHKKANFARSCVDTEIIKLLKLFSLFEHNSRNREEGYLPPVRRLSHKIRMAVR
jgi:hypothetical protein